MENVESKRYRHRSELALYRRCRRGASDALRAMLYRNADRWYTATMLACEDEAVAADTVREVWDAVVQRLSSWRFGGEMDPRSRAILRRLLLRHSSAKQATWATETVRHMSNDELIPIPEAVMGELLATVTSAAAVIAEAYERRGRRRKTVHMIAVSMAFFAIGIFIWNLMIARQITSTQLAWGCLKERVERQDVAGTLADVLGELAAVDQYGTDGVEILQKAGLIAEEIANASQSSSLVIMRHLGDRSRAEKLSEGLNAIADRYSGEMREELMHVALMFEEVESW